MPLPPAAGLYDPRHEHDACGLGFIADLRGAASNETVQQAIEILRRLAHRGAAGADPDTGDGAGILTQIPHAFFERVLAHQDRELPLAGDYAVAQVFLSRDRSRRALQMGTLEDIVRRHGQKVIAWRDVPCVPSHIGPAGRATMPVMKQLFVGRMCPQATFERTCFMMRKRAGREASRLGIGDDFYIASFSAKTVVYKGLTLPERLGAFYTDLLAGDFRTRLAVVHSRFSTNTFPTWERAHPYRRIAHNGEINTLRGNQRWMGAREALLGSRAFGEHLEDFKPIIRPGGSDSASLDNVVDFLMASGRSLPHVMMMLVPEAWAGDASMDPDRRAFYEYHASLVEPWDGPAALVFTDGDSIGAMLDRNGLRPARWVLTRSGLLVVASEAGVIDVDPTDVEEKGRLTPGRMLLADLRRGRIVPDEELKRAAATRQPYAEWLADHKVQLEEFPAPATVPALTPRERDILHRTFGYTREDLETILAPMARTGEEPVGSMGADSALAVLSDRPVPLFRYFKQNFAQVTNPPIDPYREALVMELTTCVGAEGNLLEESPAQCRLLVLPDPILAPRELESIRQNHEDGLRSATLAAAFDAAPATDEDPATRLRAGLDALLAAADAAVASGAQILVVSDRIVDPRRAPVPSLLAVAAVHHHLIRAGTRARVGLVAESGDAREIADVALLVGYGAGAVCPYLAFDTVTTMADLRGSLTAAAAAGNYEKALHKGLLKVMSKMGISALSSYHGAQIFEAVGLGPEVVERYFTDTASAIGGIGLGEIAADALVRHAVAFAPHGDIDVGGVYAWRAKGERHLWTPDTVASLQKAVQLGDAASYASYARLVDDQEAAPCTLRGLWDMVPGEGIPIEDVEPAREIVRRFATGAMSFGSIGKEAHENLAVAMNRIGGRSNTGEGGEDEARYLRDLRGDSRRSAIKQIASGRFGVTSHYLVSADELQIKMAQGAKPGEGGQLPGHKVDAVIARVRHATPGVTLISPPPHHDIYSIEDLAQLIFDLRSVNPRARISVKLVSETGVGTVAAGVAKAHADAILISGHDGGTGASPLSSIQHAGTPWELGLAEAQQVLVMNDLRQRVVLQTDGQLKTGRDVAIAALLGAEEFGFATAPLVAQGCVMMRKCHLNTCPVGIATQDPVLRARFRGQPEHVIQFFFFVAEQLRGIMAELGFRRVRDMVGRTDRLVTRPAIAHPKARRLDFGRVLAPPLAGKALAHDPAAPTYHPAVDAALIDLCGPALDRGEPVRSKLRIQNKDRSFGAALGGEISRRRGKAGFPEGTIVLELEGSAGQSFGAFLPRGVTLELRGEVNDYAGKGLSGGVISVGPPAGSAFVAGDNVICGNTALYGATSGRAFFSGRAGERFAVRNSGASAVVEGVGDHGCEYMTGGVVIVLGPTGRNFAAGMSGGIAYVLDPEGAFAARCNPETIELSPVQDAAELLRVRDLVREHELRTGSPRATEFLDTWPFSASALVKVLPTEYKRALEAQAARPGAPRLTVVKGG